MKESWVTLFSDRHNSSNGNYHCLSGPAPASKEKGDRYFVREFIKSYSSAGCGFGAPSVMNHIGISKFDPSNRLHKRLSELSKTLHKLKAENSLSDVEKYEKEVDEVAREMFGIK
jgi:hypothetical protein